MLVLSLESNSRCAAVLYFSMEKPDSRVVAIEITDDMVKKKEPSCSRFHHDFLGRLFQLAGDDPRKLLHCVKVGCALLLVSLLYLIEPLYEQVGDNAMWAIMTVVVMFEYTAGNRDELSE